MKLIRPGSFLCLATLSLFCSGLQAVEPACPPASTLTASPAAAPAPPASPQPSAAASFGAASIQSPAAASSATASAPKAAPAVTSTATQPAMDDCTTVIRFPVPAGVAERESQAMVVVPRSYAHGNHGESDADSDAGKARHYPVIYLLHGYGATHLRYHEKWTEAGKSLTDLADRFEAILVMPNANRKSWYLDAPTDVPDSADWQYETLIIDHVLPEIDRRFRTWTERAGRGVTGISMGGHGAIYLSARHPELFAAASSMSGIMDLRETTAPAALAERIGTFEQNRNRWVIFSVLSQAEKFAGKDVALLLDIGWDDPFIWSNRALHHKLMLLGVDHDYIERPGRHEWKYWYNALPYHLQFIADRLKPAGTPQALE